MKFVKFNLLNSREIYISRNDLCHVSDHGAIHSLGMAAIQETRYTGVWVRRLEEDGASSLVYPNTVSVSTVYDPRVRFEKQLE